MFRTMVRTFRGPNQVIELQRVRATKHKHGSYRVAVKELKLYVSGTYQRSQLVEVDSVENIKRESEAKEVFEKVYNGGAL